MREQAALATPGSVSAWTAGSCLLPRSPGRFRPRFSSTMSAPPRGWSRREAVAGQAQTVGGRLPLRDRTGHAARSQTGRDAMRRACSRRSPNAGSAAATPRAPSCLCKPATTRTAGIAIAVGVAAPEGVPTPRVGVPYSGGEREVSRTRYADTSGAIPAVRRFGPVAWPLVDPRRARTQCRWGFAEGRTILGLVLGLE